MARQIFLWTHVLSVSKIQALTLLPWCVKSYHYWIYKSKTCICKNCNKPELYWVYNRWFQRCIQKHNSFILTEKTNRTTLKRPLQLNNTNKTSFILYTFLILCWREQFKDYATMFIYIHCVEGEKRQRDSILCFLMKHFLQEPGVPFFKRCSLQLSIKQDVKKSDFEGARIFNCGPSLPQQTARVGMNRGQAPLTT